MYSLIRTSTKTELIQVKSISGAWDMLRNYRDKGIQELPPEELNGEEIVVEDIETKEIKLAITFKKNTKGKIEFRDTNREKAKQSK